MAAVDTRTFEKSESDVIEAARRGDVGGVSRYLVNGGNVDFCSSTTKRTLLHIACRQGYSGMVTVLLSHGANPEATTLRQLSPLHLAAHEGHFKVACRLLEAWAPVDYRDRVGNTPLHLAARKGHMDVVRLLLQYGANKDAVDESGWVALHFAVWMGHTGIARMLLQAGADVGVCDFLDKATPLHLACSSGHPEVAKLLVEFGANSSALDANGALPDHVIGINSSGKLHPSIARELSGVLVGHRTSVTAKDGSSSLECVVDSLRAKVYELEDQLSRAGRKRLECSAYAEDSNHRTFTAALRPECPVCQADVKEAVLEPCRHLAACWSCAESLTTCPFCSGRVSGYGGVESSEAFACISSLEEETAGLRTRLEKLGGRVRDLVTINGDLRLDLQRAKADAAVLTEEKRAMEDRRLAPPSPPSPVLPSPSTLGDMTNVSDCGSFLEESVATVASRSPSFVDVANGGKLLKSPSSLLPAVDSDEDAEKWREPGSSAGRKSSIDDVSSSFPTDIVTRTAEQKTPNQRLPSRYSQTPMRGISRSGRKGRTHGSRNSAATVGNSHGGGSPNSIEASVGEDSQRVNHSPRRGESSPLTRKNSTSSRSRQATRWGKGRKWEHRARPLSPTPMVGSHETDSGRSTPSELSPTTVDRQKSKHKLWVRENMNGVYDGQRVMSDRRRFVEAPRPASSLPCVPNG